MRTPSGRRGWPPGRSPSSSRTTAPPPTSPASCSSFALSSRLGRRLRLLGQQPVAVDDGGPEGEELSVGVARLVAQHVEGGRVVDGVALHQDALRALDDGAPPECPLEVV